MKLRDHFAQPAAGLKKVDERATATAAGQAAAADAARASWGYVGANEWHSLGPRQGGQGEVYAVVRRLEYGVKYELSPTAGLSMTWHPLPDGSYAMDLLSQEAPTLNGNFGSLFHLANRLRGRWQSQRDSVPADDHDVQVLDWLIDEWLKEVETLHRGGHSMRLTDPLNILYFQTAAGPRVVLPDAGFRLISKQTLEVPNWCTSLRTFEWLWQPHSPETIAAEDQLKVDRELIAIVRILTWTLTGESAATMMPSPKRIDPAAQAFWRTRQAGVWRVLYRVRGCGEPGGMDRAEPITTVAQLRAALRATRPGGHFVCAPPRVVRKQRRMSLRGVLSTTLPVLLLAAVAAVGYYVVKNWPQADPATQLRICKDCPPRSPWIAEFRKIEDQLSEVEQAIAAVERPVRAPPDGANPDQWLRNVNADRVSIDGVLTQLDGHDTLITRLSELTPGSGPERPPFKTSEQACVDQYFNMALALLDRQAAIVIAAATKPEFGADQAQFRLLLTRVLDCRAKTCELTSKLSASSISQEKTWWHGSFTDWSRQ